jgi:hypothetical protein
MIIHKKHIIIIKNSSPTKGSQKGFISISDSWAFVLSWTDQGRLQSVTIPELEKRVLCHVEEKPGTSTRRTAAMESIFKTTAVWMLQEQLLYACPLQWVQGLTLLTIPEEWHSASNFFRYVQPIHISYLTFCSLMRQYLYEMALSTSIILMCG